VTIGWDHPATADAYERFCRRHARYQRANEVLVRESALGPGLRVLDFGAGTGRTASAALRCLGPAGAVVCVEPADAMRAAGCRRLRDARVTWRSTLPDEAHPLNMFDRVLAGAMIWQLDPLDGWIQRLAALLRPGGVLAFNVPALYLGEPDDDGGGHDPLLLDLVARLASDRPPRGDTSSPPPLAAWRHSRDDVGNAIRRAGLQYRAWEFRYRLTQTAFARWLTIPVLTEGLFADVSLAERERRIDDALATVDRRSFKWERWHGWTAWRP
jgi:SAM-dependent methyltransferase